MHLDYATMSGILCWAFVLFGMLLGHYLGFREGVAYERRWAGRLYRDHDFYQTHGRGMTEEEHLAAERERLKKGQEDGTL